MRSSNSIPFSRSIHDRVSCAGTAHPIPHRSEESTLFDTWSSRRGEVIFYFHCVYSGLAFIRCLLRFPLKYTYEIAS